MAATWFPLLVALSVGTGVLGLGMVVLVRFGYRSATSGTRAALDRERLVDRELIPAVGLRDVLARMLRPGSSLERLADQDELAAWLAQAGWRDPRMPSLFMAIRFGAAGLGVVLVLVGWGGGVLAPAPAMGVAYVFAGMAVGYLAPYYGLRRLAAGRRQRIARQTQTLTQLLILVLDAGLSTRQALALIAEQGRKTMPDLARELRIALRQIESGGDQGDVIKELADALQVDDLATVVDVLRQVDQYGGAIKQPLQEALAWMEEHRRLMVRERVSRLSGHMTIVMVVFFLPALLIFIGGPAFLAVMQALQGAQ